MTKGGSVILHHTRTIKENINIYVNMIYIISFSASKSENSQKDAIINTMHYIVACIKIHSQYCVYYIVKKICTVSTNTPCTFENRVITGGYMLQAFIISLLQHTL